LTHKEREAKELDLTLLREIEKISDQKSLAKRLGFSVGKVNYVINELIKKGLVKTENFVKSKNKRGYKYLLTPKGVEEKIKLTKAFIEIKKREYEELKAELERSKEE
jgi:EPS-associated MarR family transcriptional regulator